MKKFLTLSLIVFTALVGCAPTTIDLQPLPTITAYMEVPEIPQEKDLSLSVLREREATDVETLTRNVTARPNFRVAANNPTVVISVPAEEQAAQQRRKQLNAMSPYDNRVKNAQLEDIQQQSTGSSEMGFQTDGYFNKAEQQIEKSLLRKGFYVLDRSKFEAILRDRRSKKVDTKHSDLRDAQIRELNDQFEKGLISQQSHLDGLAKIDSDYQRLEENTSRKAGEKELVDISELIRAAQGTDVNADYLLQVNNFDVRPITDRTIRLSDQPDVKQLIKDHAGLLDAMKANGANTIQRPGYFGYMNAKLIEVKTGAIVWVGEHRVESSNTEDINIELIMKKYASNRDEFARVVDTYNDKLDEMLQRAKREALKVNDPSIGAEQRKKHLEIYNDLFSDLQMIDSVEKPSLPEWTFAYDVNSPQITPEFPSQHDMQVLEQTVANLRRNGSDYEQEYNRFLRLKNQTEMHQAQLVKIVARELIDTIPSEY